jgi:hypothetical protein
MLARAVLGFTLCLPLARPATAADVSWDASSHVLPDSACPPWTAVISDSIPRFVGDSLRIETTICAMNAHYRHDLVDSLMPDTLKVAARLRLESRDECLGPCGHFRDAASIAVTTGPQVGTALWVGANEIFLSTGCAPGTAVSLDTESVSHTYGLTIDPDGTVTVEYDGAPVLTGSTYFSTTDFATTPRVAWGDVSSFAYGTTFWELVSHNAHPTGCAVTSVDREDEHSAWAGSSGPTARPSPFRDETTIHYALSRPGPAQVDIYDVAGRHVRRLVDTGSAAGVRRMNWGGLDADGRPVRPGTYLYRVKTSEGTASGKVLRIR